MRQPAHAPRSTLAPAPEWEASLEHTKSAHRQSGRRYCEHPPVQRPDPGSRQLSALCRLLGGTVAGGLAVYKRQTGTVSLGQAVAVGTVGHLGRRLRLCGEPGGIGRCRGSDEESRPLLAARGRGRDRTVRSGFGAIQPRRRRRQHRFRCDRRVARRGDLQDEALGTECGRVAAAAGSRPLNRGPCGWLDWGDPKLNEGGLRRLRLFRRDLARQIQSSRAIRWLMR